jgi:hypothetical protein
MVLGKVPGAQYCTWFSTLSYASLIGCQNGYLWMNCWRCHTNDTKRRSAAVPRKEAAPLCTLFCLFYDMVPAVHAYLQGVAFLELEGTWQHWSWAATAETIRNKHESKGTLGGAQKRWKKTLEAANQTVSFSFVRCDWFVQYNRDMALRNTMKYNLTFQMTDKEGNMMSQDASNTR